MVINSRPIDLLFVVSKSKFILVGRGSDQSERKILWLRRVWFLEAECLDLEIAE